MLPESESSEESGGRIRSAVGGWSAVTCKGSWVFFVWRRLAGDEEEGRRRIRTANRLVGADRPTAAGGGVAKRSSGVRRGFVRLGLLW